ncbi:MAG: GGDEF domain-containing protein, partial [Acholeplasmatales bacterium]|nr:GGDEF domain-containing protein [Acholeplasmatales bacterium]
EVMSLANLLYASIIVNKDNYSVVFFGFMMLLPMIYVTKPWISLVENLVGYIFYLIFALIYKSTSILGFDLIYALLFYSVSNIVIIYIRNVHLTALQSSILFKKEAQIDKLTNLFNKSAIELYANEVLAQNKQPLALIIIDVDNFKLVNDRWGHTQGDLFLSHVSSILAKTFQKIGIVGRIGGDEFIILVENVYDKDLVSKRINLAIDNISKAFIDYSAEKITCSCGVAYKELDQVIEYRTLFDQANKALYLAKEKGKNQCIIYKPEDINPNLKSLLALGFDTLNRSLFLEYINLDYNLIFVDEINLKNNEYNDISGIIINIDKFEKFKDKNLRENKKINPSWAIIAVSNNEIIRSNVLANGADAFISLPTKKAIVVEEINKAINKRNI